MREPGRDGRPLTAGVPISVVDLQWPGDVPALAPLLDELGYRRYWLTEHHSPGQSASPSLVAAIAAGLTEQIRVGTAGVLLRGASALRVAQDFAVLELYFPGRIDLGVAGALPGAPYREALAHDVRIADDAAYRDRVHRLVGHARGHAVGPTTDTIPELWICGTGRSSALLAAELGCRYAYHHYLGKNDLEHGLSVVAAYRDEFRGAADLAAPYVAVAAYGACTERADDAQATWDAHFAGDVPAPSFVGDRTACNDQLAALAASYRADELVIDCFASSHEARVAGLRLLAPRQA